MHDVAFSPDGRYLAIGSNMNSKVWDLTTRQARHSGSGIVVAFRPDGKVLASGCLDGAIRLAEIRADLFQNKTFGLFPKGGPILKVAFTPEGRYLATANPDGTVYILKLAELGEVFQVQSPQAQLQPQAAWQAHHRLVTALQFADNGNTLISASKDGFVKLWRAEPRKGPGDAKAPIQSIAAQEDGVRVIARTADGKTLATAGFDIIIRLWDAKGNQLHELPGHKGGTMALCFGANGLQLLSGGADGKVGVWNVKDGKPGAAAGRE